MTSTTSGDDAQTAVGILLDSTGKSDWQVATELGIHPSLISRYRTGERKPSQNHARLLAAYFNCPADTIFDAPNGVQMSDLYRVIEVSGPIPLEPETEPAPSEWVE